MLPIVKILIVAGIAAVFIGIIISSIVATQLSKSNDKTTITGSNVTISYVPAGSGTTTTALPFYGVQRNLSPSSLPSGWTSCYTALYSASMSSSTLSSIRTSCYKDYLLLACRPTGTTTFTVAAMGHRDDVLYNCYSTTSCKHVANGVGWYYSTSYSWGFTDDSYSVQRSICDISGTNPNSRLCWHTNGDGGYRCGSVTNLNSSTSYQKIIYHSL